MPLSRDCTKEQKAQIFKEYSSEYLTTHEAKEVKVALALFMKNKDTPSLVDRLGQILTTPDKCKLYDAIGLFIPTKFLSEYTSLSNKNDGVDDPSQDSAAPTEEIGEAPMKQSVADQKEFEDATAAPTAAAHQQDHEAAVHRAEEDSAAVTEVVESDAAQDHETSAVATIAEQIDFDDASGDVETEVADTEKGNPDEGEKAVSTQPLQPPVSADTDKREAARARRRQLEEEAEKRHQAEQSTILRSGRRGTIMGKAGGVAAMRAKMRSLSEEGSEITGGVKLREHAVSRKGIVRQTRMSHIDSIKRSAREGPVDRTELLVESEKAAGEKEGGKIVIYTTSVTGILATKSNCNEMRAIFQRLRVPFEERNIYMDKNLATELEQRRPGSELPQAFFNGEHLGGFDEVFKLNETGGLKKLTRKMKKIEVNITGDCKTCGGEGFLLCTWCGGNKRKSMAIEYKVPTRQTAFLKCTACNENGLMMCPDCMTQVTTSSASSA